MGLARKGKGGGHGGGGGHDGSGGLRWLLTYADMITLLLALFVYLFSISTISAMKLQAFTQSFANVFGVGSLPSDNKTSSGGNAPLPFPGLRRPNDEPADSPHKQKRIRSLAPMLHREQYVELEKKLSELLPELTKEGRLSFEETREGLILRLRENALFGLGSADMAPAARATLDVIGESLRKIGNSVRVEGHTDNVPLRGGNYKSNWELSGARAAAVLEHFIEADGVQPERMSLAGYGEYRPVAENLPGVGNPQNRRVEILILNTPHVPTGVGSALPSTEAETEPAATAPEPPQAVSPVVIEPAPVTPQ